MRPKKTPPPSRPGPTGTMPDFVSRRSSSACSGPPSTKAVPSVGWPANGTSAVGGKIRMRACPSPSGGSTKTVSDRFVSRARRCISSSPSPRPSVKTASAFPASGVSVKTSATTYRKVRTNGRLCSARAAGDRASRRGCVRGAGRAEASHPGRPRRGPGARAAARRRRHPARGGVDAPAAPRSRNRAGARAGGRPQGRARRAAGARRDRGVGPRRGGGARRDGDRGRPPAGLLPHRGRARRRRGARLPARWDARDRALVSAIAVRGLRKSYGALEAVSGIEFEVQRGEVFGLLGPNGAGKTTTVEILEGYRKRDAGEVEVLGTDPQRAGGDWREQIGVVLQSSAMYETLTPAEILRLFAGYYRKPRPVDEVIELVGLAEKRDDRVRRLSGGQRRRLDLGPALIGAPELIFLDEPTTGFDPAARRRAWELIADLKDLGKTILLTTHYMEEAQFLADRVVVVANGRVIAEGTPDTLGRGQAEAALVTFRTPAGFDASELPLPDDVALEHNGATLSFRTPAPTADLAPLLSWAT